jgi:hypothetical protein
MAESPAHTIKHRARAGENRSRRGSEGTSTRRARRGGRSLNRAGCIRKYGIRMASDQANRPHHQNQNDRQHYSILGDVLALVVPPQLAKKMSHVCTPVFYTARFYPKALVTNSEQMQSGPSRAKMRMGDRCPSRDEIGPRGVSLLRKRTNSSPRRARARGERRDARAMDSGKWSFCKAEVHRILLGSPICRRIFNLPEVVRRTVELQPQQP